MKCPSNLLPLLLLIGVVSRTYLGSAAPPRKVCDKSSTATSNNGDGNAMYNATSSNDTSTTTSTTTATTTTTAITTTSTTTTAAATTTANTITANTTAATTTANRCC